MKIVIPEYKTLDIDTLFLDFNGTIAVDGIIPAGVKQRLTALAELFRIYILTADTNGNAKDQCEGLPVILQTFPTGNAREYKPVSLLIEEGKAYNKAMKKSLNTKG